MRAIAVGFVMLTLLARGESGPSDAAISFLIDVARERVDLEEDTAMNPGTTSEKEADIRERIKRLSSNLEQGDLRKVDERIEGSLAAVLVSRIIDYDPSQVQVYAIAMLKREDRWLPAPILGSFENTGITYLPGLSEPARDLEAWLLIERTNHLARLRKDIQADLLEDIHQALSIKELRRTSPADIIWKFIEACRAGNLPAALAYLGGLEDPLPENWEAILQFTSSNIRGGDKINKAWRLITDTAGSRAIVDTDVFDDGAMVSIGHFSPLESTTGRPFVSILHFPLDRSEEGLWRLRLPSWLLDGELPEEGDPGDEDLILAFPTKLMERQAPVSFSSPEALVESLQQALSSAHFESILTHIGLPGSDDALTVLERAAQLWRTFRGRESHAPLLLEVRQENDHACALLSVFDARNPQITHRLIKRVLLTRKDDFWTIPCNPDESPEGPYGDLIEWAETTSKLSEADWLTRLGLTATLGGIPADSAPTEEDALAAANAWLDAIRSRNPRAILSSVASFDDGSGTKKLLRAIGHELQADHETKILKLHRNGRWAAVSVHATSTNRSGDSYYLLFPIVSTSLGPRVLAESVLYYADSRSLEFINSSALNRLEDRLPDAAVAELREIQKAHNTLAETP